MPVGVEPLPPDEVELVEVEGVDVVGLLTVELDGLLEAEDPLDWLGDTVYTADGFGRLLELELELEGLLIDEAAGLLLADPVTVLPPAGLLVLEDDGRYAEGLLAFDVDGLYADCLLPRPPRA